MESLILSLASFYAFSREYAEVAIHEDDSFTKKDILTIKNIFPWAKLILLKDADIILRQKGFSEKTINLRHKHKLLIKAIDFHHIESRKRVLIIDTDVFFLKNISELWSKITEGEKFIFNDDREPAYGSSKKLLEKVLGRKLEMNPAPYVNTGLIVEPSAILREAKTIIDGYCKEFENFSYQRPHCIEQGFIACFLKNKKVEECVFSGNHRIIGHQDMPGTGYLKKYDFENNPDNVETIHLCGWNKLGKDFGAIRTKLLSFMKK
ncbi:unnamed protein product, partial [marine sediment metagenome]